MPLEIIPIILGLWAGWVVFIFGGSEDNFLRERLKKTGGSVRKKRIFANLAHILKPISIKNIANSVMRKKLHALLYSYGVASSDDDILEFESQRLLSLLIVVIFSAVILFFSFNTLTLYCVIIVCFLTYKYPEYRIVNLTKKKQREFTKFFPDALDLLSVCVEAGLGIDGAIEKVAQEFSELSKEVSFEFTRLSRDVMSGLSREDALKNMAKRVNTQDLHSFCAMLIQSEKMGTSVAQSLRVYCDTLRTRKKQRVEELVQSASTKMTIPMILFLLPALFIVILYPAVIKIMENMAG